MLLYKQGYDPAKDAQPRKEAQQGAVAKPRGRPSKEPGQHAQQSKQVSAFWPA